jgi:hypothetical protein
MIKIRMATPDFAFQRTFTGAPRVSARKLPPYSAVYAHLNLLARRACGGARRLDYYLVQINRIQHCQYRVHIEVGTLMENPNRRVIVHAESFFRRQKAVVEDR